MTMTLMTMLIMMMLMTGYTTNVCGFRWAGAFEIVARVFQVSLIIPNTFNHNYED